MVQSQDTTDILKENYEGCAYQGAAPTPLPKVKEDLPWEQIAQKEEELQQKFEETVQISDDKQREMEDKGGVASVIGQVTDVVTKVATTVGHGLHKLTREAILALEDAQKTRVKERFPTEKDEVLMYEYSCHVLTGENVPVDGWFYITSLHVGFFSDCGEYKMKLWLPLDKIVSIQRGFSKKSLIGKDVTVELASSEEVNSEKKSSTDAILIYTSENEVHKFYGFGVLHDPISSYIDHAWNVLDHAWRDSKEELEESKKATRTDPWLQNIKEQGAEKHFDKDPRKDFEGDMKRDFQKDYQKREEQRQKKSEQPTKGSEQYGVGDSGPQDTSSQPTQTYPISDQ